MRVSHLQPARLACAALIAAGLSPALVAQQPASDANIVVEGQLQPDPATMSKGPEVKGIISARSTDRIRITTADGTSTVVSFNETTRIKGSSNLFGGKRAKPAPMHC